MGKYQLIFKPRLRANICSTIPRLPKNQMGGEGGDFLLGKQPAEVYRKAYLLAMVTLQDLPPVSLHCWGDLKEPTWRYLRQQAASTQMPSNSVSVSLPTNAKSRARQLSQVHSSRKRLL